jgi:hypothetical protein
MEAEPELVTLFSSPLLYDPRGDRYTKHYTKWGNGLRYITPEYAANILSDVLIKAKQDLKGGSESYRHFVERGIEVIKQILTQYELEESSLDKSRGPGPSVKTGGSLPDKLLGKKGERLIYERERQYVIEQGFDPDKVAEPFWAEDRSGPAQTPTQAPYDLAFGRGCATKARRRSYELGTSKAAMLHRR